MVNISRIIKGKQNIIKLDCRPLEDVQGIIAFEQRERSGGAILVKQDEILKARRNFNLKTLRPLFMKNLTALSFTTTTDFRSEMVLSERWEDHKVEKRNDSVIKML